ncbi:MAG: hypothetical protein ACTSUF_02960 [Candidatus Heimdallarchaeaceae archaeon]
MKMWLETFLDSGRIVKIIKDAGFSLTKTKPDFIIVYGGDGTILRAENKYPSIPKIPIMYRNSTRREKAYKFYTIKDLNRILKKIKSKSYRIKKFRKIEALYKNKKIIALNEIQIRNKDPRTALRFSLEVGNKKLKNIIGDGIVASTSFGSFAYYRALGNKPFKKGFKIGFNNVFPRRKPIKINENSPAIVTVERENGILTADNSDIVEINTGESVTIKPSKSFAKFVVIS